MGNVNVARSLQFFNSDNFSISDVEGKLKLPVFVKPNNGGSSLGISKVKDIKELQEAVDKAFKEDDQIIIEEFVKGRELTIGVFKSKKNIIPLPITEIISKNEFFDFEAKYLGASEEITPAKVDDHIASLIKNEAVKIYKLFNCRGVVRIDFIFNEEADKPFLLEINTVPGQSNASIVPQQVIAMGFTLKEFYTTLIEECF